MSELEEYKAAVLDDLGRQYEWVAEKTDKLLILLGECESKEEVDLVAELIGRFKVIEEKERYVGYAGMADYMAANDLPDKTLILAMTKGSDPDSGQKVLQDLKTFLFERGLRSNHKRNYFGFSPKRDAEFERIMIVDEFLGSGKTVEKRVNELIKFDTIREIHVCLLSGVDHSIEKLSHKLPEKVKIYCHFKIKRGIWEFNNIQDRFRKTHLMIDMESRLSSKIGKRDFSEFRFGYGNAQSLVSFGKYNIPNSVFPIFWWPNDDLKRRTLFIRDEDGFI